MTADATADSPGEASKQLPSTAGMTTKVVKGSMWTLAGQVAPLLVSLVTTPFVIRMLGAEGYGVFILIGLIPTYLGFADFGMSMASTKFASEAYAEGDLEKEARIVRTAALIALCTSVPIAVLVMIFAGQIIAVFNVPQQLVNEAILALRIASVTFVLNFLGNIFNSPQLARLRMDLNMLVNAGSRILGLILMPFVLYLGFGIVGAISALLSASILNLVGQLAVAHRLSPKLPGFKIERLGTMRIVRFGFGLTGAGIGFLLLSNLDKGVLPALITVEELAYYSVAFTLASLMTLLSQSMTQSLLPAFSRLNGAEDRSQGSDLYARTLRLNLILLIPCLAILAIIAEPFFAIWAGPSFEENSTTPFLVLLVGVLFNLPANLPMCAIVASGRTGLLAKIYLFELPAYVFGLVFLTTAYGATGTAFAWSLRAILDSLILFVSAKKITGFSVNWGILRPIIPGGGLLVIPVLLLVAGAAHVFALLALFVALIGFFLVVWFKLIDRAEAAWVRELVSNFAARLWFPINVSK